MKSIYSKAHIIMLHGLQLPKLVQNLQVPSTHHNEHVAFCVFWPNPKHTILPP